MPSDRVLTVSLPPVLLQPVRRSTFLCCVVPALILLLLATPVIAEDEEKSAVQLLKQMSHTVRSLNYSGDFVYQTGEVLNAMHIMHSVQGGFEKEHLVTLTGPNREIIRDNFTLTRYAPDHKELSVSERKRSQVPTLATFDPVRLEPLYRIELLGKERVAGRPVNIVAVMPRDAYRYGHRLYLDEATALPLRRVIVDRQGGYVSQIMFTSVDISDMEDAKALDQSEIAEGVKAIDYQGEWIFKGLPDGFIMEMYDQRDLGAGPRDHFLFSDGITRLSLYIEDANSEDGLRQSNVGGVGILSTRVDGRRVTVVGEAPIESLKLFLRSVGKRITAAER